MSTFLLRKNCKRITSVGSWFEFAKPKMGKRHWVDDRSAKALAQAWFPDDSGPMVPAELGALFVDNSDFPNFALIEGEPEAQVQLDRYPGEPRNADLVLLGSCTSGRIAISIEAKADESFGRLIADVLRSANPGRSNLMNRICLLTEALFEGSAGAKTAISELRYQLLHGVAAALIYAKLKGAGVAVFVVHEILSEKTDMTKIERNARDLNAFIFCLTKGNHSELSPGTLIGPIDVPGGGFVPADIPLYIGKARRCKETVGRRT